MNRRGFTIVELIIVIVIMGILLTLALVNLRSTQVSTRDKERTTDIGSIALSLEQFYQSGTDGSTDFSHYPSTGIAGSSNIQLDLRDADLKVFTPPGATDADTGFVMASNNLQTETTVSPLPTIATYVYQPLTQTGALCTPGLYWCAKFNLFYRLEVASADCPSPGFVCKVTSRHQ